MISEEQVDFVSRQIKESGITSQALQDDLIDHFCCLIEIDMQKGISFEKAYQKAFQQTTPNGFTEIQHETLFLINHKTIIIMKQFTYISGYIFALSTTVGAFFKIMHLPGASVLMFSGLLGISFIFLPMLLINKFKNKVFSLLSEKLKWILGTASLMIIITASIFKMLHLQGAGILLGIGFLVFGLGFLPFLFFRMYQSGETEISN
ncbi:hypothetical protein GCM10011506_00030 [Marivirga lumbricoides]|uniref:DUF1129 domain-containing protein n=1 Tax=Marivirga lumbricoides TaxID=1046115 RepID=A0ABQ1L5Y9_9BACT|nr:hypothetical protein GCM10011506_00030 [Marivirga lumbricoides]